MIPLKKIDMQNTPPTPEHTTLTLSQFNDLHVAAKRYNGRHIKLHAVKRHTLTKWLSKKNVVEGYTENGIPFTKVEASNRREVFDSVGFNKVIVRYLELFTPCIRAAITDTKGRYNNSKKIWVANTADRGRPDVTAQYTDFELCIETKQKNEKHLDTQRTFQAMAQQQAFRKYIITRSFDNFQEKIRELFPDVPTSETFDFWMKKYKL